MEDLMRRCALLNLTLTSEEELVWDVTAGLAAVTMRCWSSGSFEEGAGQNPVSQPETSGEQTLASLRTCP